MLLSRVVHFITFSACNGRNVKYYGFKKHFNLYMVRPFWTNCWPLVWIGVRTNVLLGPMEFAVRRPAGVLTEGSVIMWAEHAYAKQALQANFVRHACVPRGSMASNVTSVAPATWTTLTGECQQPLEKPFLLWSSSFSIQELAWMGSHWQKSSSWRTSFFSLGTKSCCSKG